MTASALVVAPLGLVLTAMVVRVASREPVRSRARGLGAASRRTLPDPIRSRLVRALADADVALDPEGATELWLGATVAGAAFGYALATPLFLVAGLAVLAAGPGGLVLAGSRRRRRLEQALPAALERAAVELRGGGTVTGAVEALAGGEGPLARDFEQVCTRARLGRGLEHALERWIRESELPGVRAAAGALAVAGTAGGRAADALEGLAASLRQRLGVQAEARALATQARLSAVVVGAAPVGYLVLSGLIDPGALRVLVATPVGQACLGVGLALEVLAALWMRRIVRIEP